MGDGRAKEVAQEENRRRRLWRRHWGPSLVVTVPVTGAEGGSEKVAVNVFKCICKCVWPGANVLQQEGGGCQGKPDDVHWSSDGAKCAAWGGSHAVILLKVSCNPPENGSQALHWREMGHLGRLGRQGHIGPSRAG